MKASSMKNIEHGENNTKQKKGRRQVICWCKSKHVFDNKLEKGEAPWSSQEVPTHCTIKQNKKENRNILNMESNLKSIEHGKIECWKHWTWKKNTKQKKEKKKLLINVSMDTLQITTLKNRK